VHTPHWLKVGLLALLYFVGAVMTPWTDWHGIHPISIMFPIGIFMGYMAVYLGGMHYLTGSVFGTLAGLVVQGAPLPVILSLSLAQAVSFYFGVWGLKRLAFDASLTHLRDVLILYFFAGGAVPMTLSLGESLALLANGGLAAGAFWLDTATWAMLFSAGIVFLAPVVLAFMQPLPYTFNRRRQTIGGGILFLMLLVCQVLFGVKAAAGASLILTFGVFICMVASAYHMGMRGLSIASLTLYLTAVINLNVVDGVYEKAATAGLVLQLLGINLGALLLAIPLVDYRKVQRVLETANQTLEIEISRRTSALKQANEDLARQVEERTRAETTLRRSEQRYRMVVEDQASLVFRWLPDSTIVFANEAYCRYRGKPLEAIVGSRLSDDISQEGRDYIARLRESLSPEKTTDSYEEYVPDADGRMIWLSWLEHALFDEQGQLVEFQSVGVDITARKQSETELELRTRLNGALEFLNERPGMLPAVLGVLDVFFGARAMAFLVNEAVSASQLQEVRGLWYPLQDVLPELLETQLLSIHKKPRELCRLEAQEVPEPMRDQNMVVVGLPVCVRNKMAASIWLGLASISEEKERLLNVVMQVVSHAFERATLAEETQQAVERLMTLRAIDMAATASTDIRVTLGLVLDRVFRHFNASAGSVLIHLPEQQALEMVVGRGFSSLAYQSMRLSLTGSLAGQAVHRREMIHVAQYQDAADPACLTLRLSGDTFKTYIAMPLIATGQVKGVLELFFNQDYHLPADWSEFLQTVAAQAAMAIENAQMFGQLQRSHAELIVAYDATIEGWARALELRDRETEGHARRVVELTLQLARRVGYPESDLVDLRRGAILHDIGKMAIPDQILLKPGPLTESEWTIMHLHTTYGYEMLLSIPYLRGVVDIPYCHHERWDGTGYPRQLKDVQIPLAARLFSLVDVYDALSSDRPYRQAWPRGRTLAYIQSQSGRAFDPQLTALFVELLSRVSL